MEGEFSHWGWVSRSHGGGIRRQSSHECPADHHRADNSMAQVPHRAVGQVLPSPKRSADILQASRFLHWTHRSDWRCGHNHHRAAAMTLYSLAQEPTMLHYAVVFLVVALIAAVLGFGGIAAGAAGIAKILFVVFLIMAVVSFIFSYRRR